MLILQIFFTSSDFYTLILCSIKTAAASSDDAFYHIFKGMTVSNFTTKDRDKRGLILQLRFCHKVL